MATPYDLPIEPIRAAVAAAARVCEGRVTWDSEPVHFAGERSDDLPGTPAGLHLTLRATEINPATYVDEKRESYEAGYRVVRMACFREYVITVQAVLFDGEVEATSVLEQVRTRLRGEGIRAGLLAENISYQEDPRLEDVERVVDGHTGSEAILFWEINRAFEVIDDTAEKEVIEQFSVTRVP